MWGKMQVQNEAWNTLDGTDFDLCQWTAKYKNNFFFILFFNVYQSDDFDEWADVKQCCKSKNVNNVNYDVSLLRLILENTSCVRVTLYIILYELCINQQWSYENCTSTRFFFLNWSQHFSTDSSVKGLTFKSNFKKL